MSYRNLYPHDTTRQRMIDLAEAIARRAVRKAPGIELEEFVHACVPLMDGLVASWRQERGAIETWAAKPFAKVMNRMRRDQAPIRVSERRVIRAGRIGKMEEQLQAIQKRLARCPNTAFSALLDEARRRRAEIEDARRDAAARVAGTPRSRHGQELSLEESLSAEPEPMPWEWQRQWKLVEQALETLRPRDAALVREMVMEGVSSRKIDSRHGISHAGASGAVRRSKKILRKALHGFVDICLEDED